jgi:hypothetical protein
MKKAIILEKWKFNMKAKGMIVMMSLLGSTNTLG